MKQKLLLVLGVVANIFYSSATTCPSATVVPAAPTLPYTQSLVCGTTNDINTGAGASTGTFNTGYLDGYEAVYVWTPTGTYSNVTIQYTGQTWSGIFLYQGCPTTGGTLIGSQASSGSSKTMTLTGNIVGGTTYYIVFDTWPTPDSPCTGTFTLNGTLLSACSAAPTPGNTLSSSTNACPSVPFTLSLQNNPAQSGFSYQWQSSSNGTTWANITGATGQTYTATQTVATYYRAIVTCVAEGTPVNSNPIQVNMNPFTSCYCTPTNSGTSCITNVSISTLNNTTSGCSASNYSQQTATTTVARGVTYTFSMTTGTDNSAIASVWVDWNQNGIYEASEWSQVYTNATNGSVQITVPMTAVLGTTGMRVRSRNTGNANGAGDACLAMGSGETEDYLITVAGPPTCPQPTAFAWLDGTTSSATLAWTPGGSETSWQVEYGAPGFTIGSGTVVNVTGTPQTTISTGLTANTFYQAYVRAVCSPSDISFNSTSVAFNTYGFGQYIEADANCGPGFEDISGNTGATNLGLTDDTEYGLTLPFPIYYQGTVVTTATIGNNGGIKFNTTTADVGYTMDAVGVYPYVQDLNTATNGGVFMQTLGTAPNRRLIVQWQNVPHYNFPAVTDGATFQVVFNEATAEIYFHYTDVEMSNPSWTNGADAEIGIRGTQNIDISMNNPTYLANNDCVHFYYTDCPKPKNLTFSNITSDEFSVDWVAGPSNETGWTLEYGPAGFTPGTGTSMPNLTSSDAQITGLNPITTYDVYVYAACANGDVSLALTGSVQTLPLCSDPYGLTGSAPHADSIHASWQWTEGALPIQGFRFRYGPTGFPIYGSTAMTQNATGTNFADTIHNPALMAGMTYQVYVQAVCPAASGSGIDTSNYVGPFSVTMPLTNDTVCYAEMLQTNGTVYVFSNVGATVSSSVPSNLEQSIAPPNTGLQTTTGWGNSTISNSTWFTFVAPNSGSVRISGTNVGYDGQMAVYKVSNCASFSSFQLIAANDNEIGGTSLAPNFTVCGLTPNQTYYLLHDPYTSGNTGTYSIKISAINLEAGTVGSLLEVCTGGTVSLFDGIYGNDAGGVWTPVIPSIQLVQDSIFASAGLAYQTFQFQYRLTDGCAYDSVVASVKVFPPSHAGNDGSLVVCRNQPFNLLQGLGGSVDMGGTWYNPSSVVVPNGNATGENVPGQYNYRYIVGNGVCPNDTSKVVVNVQNCNYLGLDEQALEGMSLYPNPTDGFVYISNLGSTEVFSYEVLDLNGRKVMTKEKAINGTVITEIDLNSMETGIYMIHVFNGNAEKTFRVVVK